MSDPIKVKRTQIVEVTGVLADLIRFARQVHSAHPQDVADDEFMVRKAQAYWKREHGED